MRCMALGEEDEGAIARMLGLKRDLVEGAMNSLVTDGYAARAFIPGGVEAFRLTETGERRLADELEEIPQEEMLVIDYDGIRRTPIRLTGESVKHADRTRSVRIRRRCGLTFPHRGIHSFSPNQKTTVLCDFQGCVDVERNPATRSTSQPRVNGCRRARISSAMRGAKIIFLLRAARDGTETFKYFLKKAKSLVNGGSAVTRRDVARSSPPRNRPASLK